MRFARRLAAVAAAVVLAAAPAMAQGANGFGGWYLGAVGGPTILPGGPGIQWNNVGFQTGYNWSPDGRFILGFEVEGTLLAQPVGVVLCCDAGGSLRGGVVFQNGQALAYGEAGVSSTLVSAGTGWWHFGGGLELAIADRLAVFGEVRAKRPFAGGSPHVEVRGGLNWYAGPVAVADGTPPPGGMAGFYFGTFAGAFSFQGAGSPYRQAGVQAGYNYMAGGGFLAGFEVDIGPAFGGFLAPGTAWCCEGTLSGRFGAMVAQNVLLYSEIGLTGRVLYSGVLAYAFGFGTEIGLGGQLGLFAEWHAIRFSGGAAQPGVNEFRVGMNIHQPNG